MNAAPGAYAVLSAFLFAIGLYGVLTRSNMLSVLIAIFVLFSAPVIALVGFSHVGGGGTNPPLGEALALFGVVAAAAQIAVGVGVTLLVWRRIGSAEVDDLNEVEG